MYLNEIECQLDNYDNFCYENALYKVFFHIELYAIALCNIMNTIKFS